MAFINRGIIKSKIASITLSKGPIMIPTILCLYASLTLLIIGIIIAKKAPFNKALSVYLFLSVINDFRESIGMSYLFFVSSFS